MRFVVQYVVFANSTLTLAATKHARPSERLKQKKRNVVSYDTFAQERGSTFVYLRIRFYFILHIWIKVLGIVKWIAISSGE